ncbi:MAG: DNA mismatch repair endonuclease MutH [Gammaproteobacteria bacterium]|nr:DNA mismatch repair endonuclease MutH [Gammaproteobacteria bacterium]
MFIEPLLHSPPPRDRAELIQRVCGLAGNTLGQLADEYNFPVPEHLHANKGWQGQLLEAVLGTTASTQAEPDFKELSIELKTIPVNEQGHPVESTYVCTVPLTNNAGLSWESSWVKRKLSTVLWIPILVDKASSISQRVVGQGLLWQPDQQQFEQLKNDWEELMDMVCLGQLDQITAHHGQILQIRPKAANARALTNATDENGHRQQTLPRGFYLRSQFTRELLQQNFIL